ncbi:hypothetical protein L198_03004 [Cryptococcus wingfieldii CBS 7118]|uniref:Methyltransferase domain-containing protein n=1 Tax=Cryptococcus wingfieldii CBS 7118 TaxID=1295528 RepID=A0A1E3JIF3_9TREE|nr:hypothetical protein L198_03004 [Cryptococcus wingfieldii CBS 7118]ODO00679.1 hypothetical protein L198_03004 [Cryptococcus wingfieldii CBS 7118]
MAGLLLKPVHVWPISPVKHLLHSIIPISAPILGYLLAFLGSLCLSFGLQPALKTPLRFIYNCFIKPFLRRSTGHQQKDHLEAFYADQADLYDATRSHLLKGRETMLQLLAAHLIAQPSVRLPHNAPYKPKIWVDLGGGTGWDIEKMDEYLPLTYFDAIYIVDLCDPLLKVAEVRIKARGWKNVHVLCQDASKFVLPEWEKGLLDPRGSLTAITMSYSLSMIPPFYQILDRCDQVLDPQRGLMGVVDFYTSRETPSYLKPEGFHALKAGRRTDAFKLHTDTILNVLRGLPDESLTKIILMDSGDWFSPIPASTPLPSESSIAPDTLGDWPEKSLEHLQSELDYEILEMKRALKVGGMAVWRSARVQM